jgi:hypothetical protein
MFPSCQATVACAIPVVIAKAGYPNGRGSLQTGYAVITTDAENPTPAGSSLFSYKNADVSVRHLGN